MSVELLAGDPSSGTGILFSRWRVSSGRIQATRQGKPKYPYAHAELKKYLYDDKIPLSSFWRMKWQSPARARRKSGVPNQVAEVMVRLVDTGLKMEAFFLAPSSCRVKRRHDAQPQYQQ
jgi:hypothetical protein